MPLSLRESECDGSGSGGFSRFTVEGEIARLYVHGLFGSSARRGICALHVNLHLALAADASGQRFVAAFASVDIVVAVPFTAVHRDPNIPKEGSILILEFSGVRGTDGEYRAALLDIGVRKVIGLLLDLGRNGRRRSAARADAAHGTLEKRPCDDEHDESRGYRRHSRISLGFLITQSIS